jgi:hypothetical protein
MRALKSIAWVCAAAFVVFLAIFLLQAFQGAPQVVPADGTDVQIWAAQMVTSQQRADLHVLVFGALAGFALVTSLACFLWSAVLKARQQYAANVERLVPSARQDTQQY